MTLPMTGAGPSGVAGGALLTYYLKAPFTGDNQAYVNAQVLNTAAEGVTEGALTVVEAGSGALALVSNECTFQGGGSVPSCNLTSQAISRLFGLTLIATVNVTAGGTYGPALLWNADASVTSFSECEAFGFYFVLDDGILSAYNRAIQPTRVAAIAAATDYQVAFVLGGYDASGNPWYAGLTPADYLYGMAAFIKGGAWSNWTRLLQWPIHNDDPVYAGVYSYNAAGTIDDVVAASGGTLNDLLQPVHFSSFDAANGTSLDAYTPEVGTGWTEHTGNMDIQSNRANLVTGASKCTVETGLSDVFINCVLNATVPADTVGLMCRYSDVDNYWLVYLQEHAALEKFRLYEVNAGITTLRASVTIGLSSGVDYQVRVALNGTSITCHIADEEVISYTSSFNQTETRHGLYCDADVTVRFNDFAVYPSASAAIEAALDAIEA